MVKYSEKENKLIQFIKNKRDKANEIMQSEYGYLYQLAFEQFDYYCGILNLIEKQQKEIEELEIYKSIYKNLRREFNKLVEKVLGKDYYNYGCDTYTCDRYTCEDIARKKVKILFKEKDSIPKEAIIEKIEELNKLILENDKLIVECRKTIMENQPEKKIKIAKARMDNVMYYEMINYLKELLGE